MSLLGIIPLASLAWNAEFPGFIHFRNWDGNVDQLGNSSILLPSGDVMPGSLALDVCASDRACTSVGWGGQSFRTMRYDSTKDVYLANSSAIVPGSFCSIESGGCLQPSRSWLHCGNDFFNDVNLLAKFDLPPEVLHTSCVDNPACVGFIVDNAGTRGSLYQKGALAEGWFTIPAIDGWTKKQVRRLKSLD